ncbi:ATP-grasp domain-containing protein [Candidatus Nesciobacter abundans]|uniref:ATP-grasp domain-containing protein n=1 Tax=Candidatus Nesciobacter abundans TaxID=2601668 RepID=A0A5C0UFG2_9PROT|nr:ATP-grasp domain-containing protein [Candidatus Nesciobacter abundans]QEK38846.1 ATP-grasp domain-containing protein [Candidatus Nesciobacter abundans]
MHNLVILSGGWEEKEASIGLKNLFYPALKDKYSVFVIDPADYISEEEANRCFEIKRFDENGRIFSEAENCIRSEILKINPVLVVNLMPGLWGEDGRAQMLLNNIGVQYTGPSACDAYITFDKYKTIQIVKKLGVKCPESHMMNLEEYKKVDLYPHIVKNPKSGSSNQVYYVDSESAKQEVVDGWSADFVVENVLPGLEYAFAVLSGSVIGGIEIKHEKPIYSKECKQTGNGVSFRDATEVLKDDVLEKVKDYCSKIYIELNMSGICRIDFKIEYDCVYFLEVNSIPGNTLVPRIFNYADLDLENMVNMHINNANTPALSKCESADSEKRRII